MIISNIKWWEWIFNDVFFCFFIDIIYKLMMEKNWLKGIVVLKLWFNKSRNLVKFL